VHDAHIARLLPRTGSTASAPTLNPSQLHRLNYEERRMAMFLAFKATMARPFLLSRLRDVSKDLVQRVITFL
jgi:hypothetical protein